MIRRFILLLFLSSVLLGACKTKDKLAGSQQQAAHRIGFYNVENLFDTVDDPVVWDEEFTPDSKKKWTLERYDKKLQNLCRVVEGMAFPAILGLCEVENRKALSEFIEKTAMSKYQYGIAHHESPDKRGIDVALLYQQQYFKVLTSEAIGIQFPPELIPDIPDYTTRDILYVKGLWQKKDTLHLFVNHWPSRRGGLAASEPKRLFVAKQLRQQVDALFSKNSAANIIIMGDFNDETDNNSLTKALQVARTPGPPARHNYLFNCTATLDQQGHGTYKYKGKWNMLDQIIVSGSLCTGQQGMKVDSPQIFQQDWMMYNDKKYGPVPSRTYGGPNYYGGYSDHLPVFVELKSGKGK